MNQRPHVRRSTSLAMGALLGLCLASEARPPAHAAAGQEAASEAGPATADDLVARLGDVWFARDFDGYLALWDFDRLSEKRAEEDAVRRAFASDETRITVLGHPRFVRGTARLAVDVQVFSATEPRARVEFWRLLLQRQGRRWVIVEKQRGSDMEGLVHLTLSPQARRARGVVLQLEDLELSLEDGTLFSSPESVGHTALVFVGRGRVRFSPRPAAEGEQLRQYSGSTRLDRTVKWAFLRLHPDDVGHVIDLEALEPDPRSARRLKDATRVWSQRSTRSFVVDGPLPRSPWWITPSTGDAVVEFPWKGDRVLTYARAGGESEDVNLFERDRGIQICSYPSAGRPQHTRGSPPGDVDVLHHTLVARFDPERFHLSAVDTIRLRLLRPVSTLRVRLHDDFHVDSVSAEGGENLLFLRVRHQGSFVVSLGAHAGRREELSLTVRYSGRHQPSPMSQELLQLYPEPQPAYMDRALLVPPPLIYSNRTAWYPQPGNEDHATLQAHFDTPGGILAVTGGELLETRTVEGRTRTTYELREPGKYFTAVVGRLEDVGRQEVGGQVLRGFAGMRTEDEMRKNLAAAESLIAFFSGLYGPNPFPVINHVVSEAMAPGGHSPPGLVYLQHRPAVLITQPLREDPADFRKRANFFLAHELAHQWWGQGVAPATYRGQWLSEAWAQYSAALWVRHREGEEAFRGMMDRMARWALRHDEKGPIHLGQRLGHVEGDARIRRSIVYNKGAWVLHMLRQLLGDEAFFGGARDFLAAHRYGKATTEDLRDALEHAGARDLEPYFERWVYETGLPRVRWATHTDETFDGFRTTVQVAPEGLPGPVPLTIEVRTAGEPASRRVVLDPAGGSWTIDSLEPVRDVRVNEDRGLLAEVEKVRRLRKEP